MTVVGIISDTHGLLRPEILLALKGSDHILHGGDIGPPDILERLCEIAPVNRRARQRRHRRVGGWSSPHGKPHRGRARPYLIHDRSHLALYPPPGDAAVVVFGHSHKALIETQDGVLYLNPGSAGPRRFRLPVAVARLYISAGQIEPEIVQLPIG
jgi:uncharacterized protein